MTRLRPLALAALVAAMAAPLAAQTAPPRRDDFSGLMAAGLAALRGRDYTEAQGALEKAVAMRPGDAQAHFLLGRAYGEAKKNQLAVTHFRETLRLAPGHVDALIDLAAIEQSTGKFQEAAEHYRQAMARGPSSRAERGLAALLARQGKPDASIQMLRALVVRDPEPESRYELGLALMQKGDCAEATRWFREVTDRQPEHLGALFNLGNCLNRLGERDEGAKALERFRAASEEESRRVERERRAYFLKLEADRKMGAGDLDGAIAALGEARGLDGADARIHAMLGQALDARGDSRGALESFRKAGDLDPGDAIVQVETGRLLGKLGRIAEAVPHLQNAARLDPAMPEPHLFLAAAYQQLGRAAEAAAEEAIYRRLLMAQSPGGAPR